MKELFKLTHVELTCTATAEETIEFFRNSQKIDLVLMDVQLPDKSGLEVTRILKEIDPHLPVIAQSAYAMTGDNIKCLQAGCDDYVSKPINICELFTKINKYIVKHY
jgi:CheY-like chemotaxis protein